MNNENRLVKSFRKSIVHIILFQLIYFSKSVKQTAHLIVSQVNIIHTFSNIILNFLKRKKDLSGKNI